MVPAPELDAVAPAAAPPGATVAITGRRLSWAAIVRFGGVNADFSVVSDERIDARVPAAAVSGPVTVLSPGGTAAVAGFVVLRIPAPALTLRVTPAVVPQGRRVRIAGSLAPAGTGAAKVAIVVQRRVGRRLEARGRDHARAGRLRRLQVGLPPAATRRLQGACFLLGAGGHVFLDAFPRHCTLTLPDLPIAFGQ